MGARRRPRPQAVDLFCGAGGLSYGMQKSGVRVRAGIDVDPSCRHPFEANVGARFHVKDAADLTPGFVRSLFDGVGPRVLAGCAPCQPFSCYAHTNRRGRWMLLDKFGELVDKIKPEIVTMENVPGLLKYRRFSRYTRTLRRAGYICTHGVVKCADYGVPQTRRRLVLLASRLGPINMPRPTRMPGGYATVKETIGHLGKIAAGGVSRSDPLHRSSGLSGRNLARIKSSVPGGTWGDWRRELLAPCHARETGRTYGAVYGRMRWDALGPTITTEFYGFGSGRFGHPEQDRAISLREGALLQTFPEDYSFVPPRVDVKIAPTARMIGNAVPVSLGAAIGKCIVEHVVECGG